MSLSFIAAFAVFASIPGFFRTEKVDGRWRMVRSGEAPFTILSTSHVTYRKDIGKSVDDWSKETVDRLSKWGFNTVGNSSLRFSCLTIPRMKIGGYWGR